MLIETVMLCARNNEYVMLRHDKEYLSSLGITIWSLVVKFTSTEIKARDILGSPRCQTLSRLPLDSERWFNWCPSPFLAGVHHVSCQESCLWQAVNYTHKLVWSYPINNVWQNFLWPTMARAAIRQPLTAKIPVRQQASPYRIRDGQRGAGKDACRSRQGVRK